jgi:electron transfer flavoprotein alpha subunit
VSGSLGVVAVLAEQRDGALGRTTLEALTLARSLGTPVVVWLGDAPSTDDVRELGAYGATEVRVVALGDAARLPAVASAGLVAAAADADAVVVISTFVNKEIATRFALATGAGVVVDAAGAAVVDGRVTTTQTVFAATWNVLTRINAERAVVGIRPNTTQAVPAEVAAEPAITALAVDVPDARESLVSVTAVAAPEGVPLAEAPVVVSGGRGTGGDYALVRELAELLGGAVGASRDATDEGWISHEHMVGQTGTTVTPALYVACGISGAVHHRGGMQASGTIVAVNLDPDAPIFEIADFGVVGSLFDVLPQAIEAIREHRGA